MRLLHSTARSHNPEGNYKVFILPKQVYGQNALIVGATVKYQCPINFNRAVLTLAIHGGTFRYRRLSRTGSVSVPLNEFNRLLRLFSKVNLGP